jgi:hypothetical protein
MSPTFFHLLALMMSAIICVIGYQPYQAILRLAGGGDMFRLEKLRTRSRMAMLALFLVLNLTAFSFISGEHGAQKSYKELLAQSNRG